MEKTLLTKVITQLVNERAKAQEYGVALVNIPDFDYVSFVQGLSSERKAALFFLGFPPSPCGDVGRRGDVGRNLICGSAATRLWTARRSTSSGFDCVRRGATLRFGRFGEGTMGLTLEQALDMNRQNMV